jgi:hypothetical protein
LIRTHFPVLQEINIDFIHTGKVVQEGLTAAAARACAVCSLTADSPVYKAEAGSFLAVASNLSASLPLYGLNGLIR